MKFSLWTQYGALNSKPVFDAFRQGAQTLGYTCVENENNSDVDVIWSVLFNGRMSRNKIIWDKNIRSDKPTIVLEVGGIKRGTTWKVGLNGINRDAYFGDSGNDRTRADSLGLVLKPWRSDGDFILICGQHDKSLQWRDMPPMSRWVMDTIEGIQVVSDLPIIFRPHPRCRLPAIEHQYKNVYRQDPIHIKDTYDDFNLEFHRVHTTISYSSNPGIHSIINGVPAVVGPSSLAYDVAMHKLLEINDPKYPDRQQWLNDYAHTEWTIQEIAQGIPLKNLTNRL